MENIGGDYNGLVSANDLIEKISMLELEIKFRDDVILTAGKLSKTGRSFRDCLYDAKCYIGVRAEYNSLDTERIYKTMISKTKGGYYEKTFGG